MDRLYKDFYKANILNFIIAGCLGFLLLGSVILLIAEIIRPRLDEGLLPLIVFCIVFCTPFIIYFIPLFTAKSRFEKFLDSMENRYVFLETLEREPIYHSGDYLIDYATLRYVKCSDVVWAYAFIHKTNGFKDKAGIICKTLEKKKFEYFLPVRGRDETKFEPALRYILSQNSDVLVGFTREYKKEYKRRTYDLYTT
jgi:hypothetical protein